MSRSSAMTWPHLEGAPSEATVDTRSGEKPARTRSAPPQTTYCYDDGTPFPYAGNFFEVARYAIECGVALVNAQVAIARAEGRCEEVERRREHERARLEEAVAAVAGSLPSDGEGDRTMRTRERLVDAARAAIAVEWAEIEATTGTELARGRALASAARMLSKRAIEAFLLRHDLPGTRRALRMVAQGGRYVSRATVTTPFGVEASFELWIPEQSAWTRIRRFGDLMRDHEVRLSAESGMFSKRAIDQSEVLDNLYIDAIEVHVHETVLWLREQPNAGAGYRFHFDSKNNPMRVTVLPTDEDGRDASGTPIELTGEDRARMLRVWKRVIEATRGLALFRRAMVSATVDGEALHEHDRPSLLGARIVQALAPALDEIVKRSGATGMLVLRRTSETGQSEELSISRIELAKPILSLPPEDRRVFAPLHLTTAARTARITKRS